MIKLSPFLIIFLFLFSFPLSTFPQSGKVPPFQMVLSNGKIFKAENIPFSKPIIIIYFSPECDDCQILMEEILRMKNSLQKASIVMITFLPIQSVKQFVLKYHLDDFSFLFVGTEGEAFFIKDYYRIEDFPYIVLYNQFGDLLKVYKKYKKDNTLLDLTNSLNYM